MPEFDLEAVVDANLYVEDREEGETISRDEIGFHEALDYANQPLEPDTIREYNESGQSGMRAGRKAVSPTRKIEKMREDYFDHVTSFNYRLILEDEKGEEYEFVGTPRTDLREGDFTTLIFPNIVTFQAASNLEEYDPEDNPHLVMREMTPYSEEIERNIVSDAKFMGEGSYDNEVAEALRGTGHNWIQEPDNFVYVDEPRDFLALNGEEGLYEEIRGTEIPEISVSDWQVLSVEDQQIVGLRPFFNEVWDSGLKPEDAKRLGRWRGVNRGIGRWVYDMDDEFFHGIAHDEDIVGFYDNEMTIAVGDDQAFETDIRNIHNQRVREASESEEFVETRLEPIMKEEEERMAEIVEKHGLNYTDFVPRKVDEDLIPDHMKVDNLF